ncbi:hypothetical protein GCM10010124_32240 [Pilimelia terevasa]|uniref:Uncharacterized protein n=1 Tax=Pilimelia terevasa TaxID=53372 RepID=A0A8J3BT82_9ACTN|nr:hypothetical protein GCM10010124_32240 [Pilimelia terevasa]
MLMLPLRFRRADRCPAELSTASGDTPEGDTIVYGGERGGSGWPGVAATFADGAGPYAGNNSECSEITLEG